MINMPSSVNVDLHLHPHVFDTTEMKASAECQDVAVTFICQYMYSLCDGSPGRRVLPSKQQCQFIRNDACATEIRELPVEVAEILPNCDNLPS